MTVDGDRALTRTYDPCELDLVAGSLVDRESYVTQNRSHGPRGRSKIAALNAVWLDLDVHRVPSLSHLERPEIETLIRDRISGAGLPPASFLVDSGRGYHVIWLFESAVAAALPRWSALMRALVEWARPLGADPACIDAARVLRLPGSWHKGACREVTVVDGTAARHDFENFSSAVWRAAGRPTRRDLGERRTRRAARAAGPIGDVPRAAPRGLSRKAFWSLSLGDLELLLDRWGGVVPNGLRNTWMHLWVTALGWTVGPDDLTERAIAKAALVALGLSAREVRRTMSSTVRRAERAASGRRGADGRDPRYDYGGGRMAEMLGIDRAVAETLGLRQIVPADLRADRRHANRVARRRAAGALPRPVWLAAHPVERERPWEAEGISRATWYRRLAAKRAIRRRALLAGLLAGSASGPESRFETGPALHYGGEAQPSASARRPEVAKARVLPENRVTPPKTPSAPKPTTENAPKNARVSGPVSAFSEQTPSSVHVTDDPTCKEHPRMPFADPHVLVLASRRLTAPDLGNLTRIAVALADGSADRLALGRRLGLEFSELERVGDWLRTEADGRTILGLAEPPPERIGRKPNPRQGALFDEGPFAPTTASPRHGRSGIKAAVIDEATRPSGPRSTAGLRRPRSGMRRSRTRFSRPFRRRRPSAGRPANSTAAHSLAACNAGGVRRFGERPCPTPPPISCCPTFLRRRPRSMSLTTRRCGSSTGSCSSRCSTAT